jgi:hypothetical protein
MGEIDLRGQCRRVRQIEPDPRKMKIGGTDWRGFETWNFVRLWRATWIVVLVTRE